ncbi:hypothetical protein HaLaN_26049 [Haematococcus lacustris]|uniref:Uncharacterized protein n=1 Tax=Haematococcus lacustris TaxID=44745 RepID=A0A6A0A5B5_HAELA|nr:hypothetical protein HaLaN_26049 [Haematococcus lacustris]
MARRSDTRGWPSPVPPEPTQPTKAAKAKPEPKSGRWLDRDCNAALNMQCIGERSSPQGSGNDVGGRHSCTMSMCTGYTPHSPTPPL